MVVARESGGAAELVAKFMDTLRLTLPLPLPLPLTLTLPLTLPLPLTLTLTLALTLTLGSWTPCARRTAWR